MTLAHDDSAPHECAASKWHRHSGPTAGRREPDRERRVCDLARAASGLEVRVSTKAALTFTLTLSCVTVGQASRPGKRENQLREISTTLPTQLKCLTNQPRKTSPFPRHLLSFPASSDPPASLSAKRPPTTIHLTESGDLASSDPPVSLSAKRPPMTIHLPESGDFCDGDPPSQNQAIVQARLLQLQFDNDAAPCRSPGWARRRALACSSRAAARTAACGTRRVSARGSVRGRDGPGPHRRIGAVLLADRRLGSWDGAAAQSCRGALACRPVRPAVGAGCCFG